MTSDLKTIIFPVKDLAQTKTLYGTLLGQEPIMDEAYYVQFNTVHQEIGLDPGGHGKGMTGPVAYWHVEDIKATLAQLLAAGATERQAVTDVGGRLIATVADAGGSPPLEGRGIVSPCAAAPKSRGRRACAVHLSM